MYFAIVRLDEVIKMFEKMQKLIAAAILQLRQTRRYLIYYTLINPRG